MSQVPAWKLKKQQEEEERKKKLEEERLKKEQLRAGAGQPEPVAQSQNKAEAPKRDGYMLVVDAIRQHGTANPNYPKDLDIEYGKLLEITDKLDLGGLGALLKVMKTQKRVDFRDSFLKDSSIVTLIEDYNQDVKTSLITYDQIQSSISPDEITSHQKTGNYF
eukprot:TRINITY_DN1466_c0_g1_i1.p2 TRINITY_DN1466_c0_g1~~TRINITY_DN1466_c0_g1_i1.p2  ORF type:complete len:163 (+),score=30.64 TRINITY_DN1466_c0_g1_i1:105-593(+)